MLRALGRRWPRWPLARPAPQPGRGLQLRCVPLSPCAEDRRAVRAQRARSRRGARYPDPAPDQGHLRGVRRRARSRVVRHRAGPPLPLPRRPKSAQGYRPIARIDQQLRAVIVGRREQPIGHSGPAAGRDHRDGSAHRRRRTVASNRPRRRPGPRASICKLAAHQTKVSCLHAAAAGEAVGCVVPSFLGDQLQRSTSSNLVPIWQSEPISSHVVAVHPRMPAAAAEAAAASDRLATTAAGVASDRLSWPGWSRRRMPITTPIRTLAARLRAASTS